MTAKHKMHSLQLNANTKAQKEASGEFYLMDFLRNSSVDKKEPSLLGNSVVTAVRYFDIYVAYT